MRLSAFHGTEIYAEIKDHRHMPEAHHTPITFMIFPHDFWLIEADSFSDNVALAL